MVSIEEAIEIANKIADTISWCYDIPSDIQDGNADLCEKLRVILTVEGLHSGAYQALMGKVDQTNSALTVSLNRASQPIQDIIDILNDRASRAR